MEIMKLKPVRKRQPTAWRGVLFDHRRLPRSDCGPIRKIAEKSPDDESSTKEVE